MDRLKKYNLRLRCLSVLLAVSLAEMEKNFGTNKPVRVALHPSSANRLAIGFIDGSIRFCDFDLSKTEFQILASRKLKRAVRELSFSNDGEQLFAACENRALCVYNIEANKRTRCIQKSHDHKINALFVLPNASIKHRQIVTGDEFGEVNYFIQTFFLNKNEDGGGLKSIGDDQ
ncbi:unnamed protein product [Onchocerca ochengi]|uniref:WD_REPEATS_REGION domain-containing protein n=1 Tax=Onchocerca ochengi TaxID=42157 RepID=A0A182E8B0_ONCOC|nr:unnamed protein product [Onchocerca ochengi]